MIFWRAARFDGDAEERASHQRLLSDSELRVFGKLRMPKRQREWLSGRIVTKDLCCSYFARLGQTMMPHSISVESSSDGSPRVVARDGSPMPITVSISHREDWAVAALCERSGEPLGIDIELCEPRPNGFVESFFTDAEVRLVEKADVAKRDRIATEVWSIKEAALKAMRVGLRADTRSVEVRPRKTESHGWGAARVFGQTGFLGHAFVRDQGPFVISVVWLGEKNPGEPIEEQRL